MPAPNRLRDELIGLEVALASMPEQQRRAILLREWQGLSYREVAEELDLSQSAVETLIFRARRSLAQGLEQPVAKPRRRLRRALHALDLGPLVGALKTLLLGGAAAKATVAAVAVTAAVSVAGVSGPKPAAAKAPVPAVASTKSSVAAVERLGRGEQRAPALPVQAVNGKAKAAANKAAATPGVPSVHAQFGQSRAAAASQGRSVAAKTGRRRPGARDSPSDVFETARPRSSLRIRRRSRPRHSPAGPAQRRPEPSRRPRALATLTHPRRRSSAGRALHS